MVLLIDITIFRQDHASFWRKSAKSVGRGWSVAPYEIGLIIGFADENVSPTEIGRRIGRSTKAVRKPLHWLKNQRKLSKRGAMRIITMTQIRMVVWVASTGELLALQLIAMYNLPMGERRVQMILHDVPYLNYFKFIKAPPLTPQHREKSLHWARG